MARFRQASSSRGWTASSSNPAFASASRAASALPHAEFRNALTFELVATGCVAVMSRSLYKKDAGLEWPASYQLLIGSGERFCRLAPESGQGRAIRRFAQLLERALADLPDSLAGDAHQRADLLQSHRVGTLLESVVEVQNLALARGEVLPEDSIDELAHEMEIGDILDLTSIDAGEALAERACFAVGSVDRRVERDLRRRHLLGGANRIGSLLEQTADLVVGGIALQHL